MSDGTEVLGWGLAALGRPRAVQGRFAEPALQPLLPRLHANQNPCQGEVTLHMRASDVVLLTAA